MRGDAPLGDHPGGFGGHGAAHDLDDRGGHVPGYLQAGRGVLFAQQGSAGEQQHVGPGERAHRAGGDLGDVGVAAGRVGDDGDLELDLGDVPAFAGHRHLAAGEADVRADDHESVPVGSPAGPDVRSPQRRLRVQPGQRLREGRPGPVQERLSGGLRVEQAQDDDVQVGVFDRVDHDERPVAHPGQDLGDPLRATEPDVVETDAVHLVRPHGAAALLGDELAQVRRREAEGGVAGELGLADRARLAIDPGPVHVAHGEPPGLQVGRDQQHPVVPATEHLTAHRVQRGDLRDDVPAQRGVAATDHLDGRAEPGAQLEQRAPEPGGQRDRIGLPEAAGVGQDEAGRAGPVEAGGDLVGLEDGDDGHIVHRLRSGGVVIEHGDPSPGVDQRLSDALPGIRLDP